MPIPKIFKFNTNLENIEKYLSNDNKNPLNARILVRGYLFVNYINCIILTRTKKSS